MQPLVVAHETDDYVVEDSQQHAGSANLDGEEDKENYKSAHMEESRQGYYLDPIITVDAASLHPRLMGTYNLSPDTLLPDDADRRIPHASLTVSPDREPLRFVAASHCRGLLPRVLDRLLRERKQVTKAMAKEGNVFKRQLLSAKRLALTMFANSVYGACGATKGLLQCREVAAATASTGIFPSGAQQALEEVAREERRAAREERRRNRYVEKMRRRFTLHVKLPGQGDGFAGKGAKVVRPAVEEAYRKKQNKEPERGFRFKKDVIQVQPAQADAEPTQSCTKQVTTAGCSTVWDFVGKCGALDGDSLECTMRYDDLPGDRQARRDKQSDKARKALLEEARVKELAPLGLEAVSARKGRGKKRTRAGTEVCPAVPSDTR